MADESGFELGKAYVSVDPDAADFDEKLAEQIGSPVVIVRVQADAADVDAQIDEQVGHHTTTVNVDANTGPAREQVDELVSSGLPKDASFTVDADTAPAKAALEELSGTPVNVDTAPAKASLAEIDGAAQETQAQLEKLAAGSDAASQALGGVADNGKAAGESLAASAGDIQAFSAEFAQVDQELREFSSAAGETVSGVDALNSAFAALGADLNAIHASGGATVAELALLQGQLGSVTAELDTMEGAFGTAATSIDEVAQAAGAAVGPLDVLNGDLAAGGSREASGAYADLSAELGRVGESGAAAASGIRATSDALAAANESFAATAAELGQLDAKVGVLMPEVGELSAQFGRLAAELDDVNASGGADAAVLENLQMRITATGAALDELEVEIPAVLAEMDALPASTTAAAVSMSMLAREAGAADLATLGADAEAGAAGVANLADDAGKAVNVFGLFGDVLGKVATSPWTWAVVGAAAVAGLTYVMTTGTSELDEYTNAIERQYHATGDNLAGFEAYDRAIQNGGAAQQELATATKDVSASMARFGTSAGNATVNTRDLTEAQQQAGAQVQDLSGHLSTLEDRYGLTQTQAERLASAAHVSAGDLAESGSAANAAMAKIEAYGNANEGARGKVSEMSNDMLTFGNDALTAKDRIGGLDDAFNMLIGNFVSSQQAQLQVESDFLTIASNAKQAGASMDGTNQASVTLQQSFFSLIPDIQNTANAMVQQGDSTQQVTTYINDQITKLSGLTGGNQQAQQAVQGLKLWEDNLRDSTGTANTALNQAAQTLEDKFTVQVKDAGVQSTTANRDVTGLATAIQNTGTKSNATKDARAQLIKDLIASGVNAKTATADVDAFIKKLGKVPKNVTTNISVTGDGKWSVQQVASLSKPGGKLSGPTGTASGWLVKGGTPGQDSVPIMAMPGELVVPTGMVQGGAVDHLRGSIPGFAMGGIVGGAGVSGSYGGKVSGAGGWADREDTATNQAVVTSVETAMANAINSKVTAAKAAAASAAHAGAAGHVSGSAGAVQSLAQRMAAARGWTGALWNDLNAVEMAEAGWNVNAQNPGSDAYGLAQFINGPGEYAQYGGSSGSAAGQITGFLNYVAQRYGTPAAAWAHEQQFHWYDQGGMLQPGATLAMNNTGQPEMVLPPSVTQALTSSTGPISQLTQSLNNPAGGVDGLQKALVDPGGPMAYLQRTLANPGGPMAQLQKAVVNPGGPVANLGKAIVNPGGPLTGLSTTIANPGGPMVNLKTTIANPGGPMVQLTTALKNFNPGGTEKGTGSATSPVKLPGAKLGGTGSITPTPGAAQPGGPVKTASSGVATGVPVYNINVNYNGQRPSAEDHAAAMIRLSAAIGVA